MQSTKMYSRSKFGAIFDAHIHTYYDLHDGTISAEDLIKITLKWGFNWVNAMAHDSLRGLPKIRKLAQEKGLPVIPALEISTGFNHILAYGVQEWHLAKDSWNPEEVIELLREQDCAIYLAHPGLNPFKGYWSPAIVKRLDIDGIEWVNGSNYFLNKRTHRWFKGWKKGKIAGTDAHHISQFGYTFTQVPTSTEDPDELVKYLKRGKCQPGGSYIPINRFLMWEIYIYSKKHFFPSFFFENSWIKPQYQPIGKLPNDSFNAEKWKEDLLKKPIRFNW
ncbi:MAG: PHP domain-containing protein [Candidatus Lokiarchaeota archaeon]|nr:PHP domain-containing protein [Candidatus Harpocratesius repetitus]